MFGPASVHVGGVVRVFGRKRQPGVVARAGRRELRRTAVAFGRNRDPEEIASIEAGMKRGQELLSLAFAVRKPR